MSIGIVFLNFCWLFSASSAMMIQSSWPMDMDTQAGNVIKDQMFLPLKIQSNTSLDFVSGEKLSTYLLSWHQRNLNRQEHSFLHSTFFNLLSLTMWTCWSKLAFYKHTLRRKYPQGYFNPDERKNVWIEQGLDLGPLALQGNAQATTSGLTGHYTSHIS